ncbi:MAG: response regulator transcription factor [Candidatus Peregrinibacteria bacterium]
MPVKNDVLKIGGMKINSVSRKFYVGQRNIFLRNKEFCLMEYFIKNAGRVVSRTQILEDVWDQNICCPTNTVDVHVSTLRQKLKFFNCGDFIRTVHCVGYIFEP